MPMYAYRCDTCGRTAEILRNIMQRDQPQLCDKCGSTTTRLLTFASLMSGSISRESSPRNSINASDNASSSKGGINVSNNTIENANIGISVPKGTNITMTGNKFKNVKTPVEFRDD